MEQNLSTHAGVAITISSDGVFSAVMGRRVFRAPTLDAVRQSIDAQVEEDAGARRKDVNVPVRVRIGDAVKSAVYLGIRANGKHAFRIDGEPKPEKPETVHVEDYWDLEVIPDSVPDSALAEFLSAVEAVKAALARKETAKKALRGRRAPWEHNVRSGKNSERVKEQERFLRALLTIKGLPCEPNRS